ncbi:MAG: heme-binding protein [Alphaproteobacteria bacterium]|nr:heme-binding protein [Alphaproteobacteria bacterium]
MAQIEEPQYKIIAKEGDFELRDYAPYIVAEVITEGERDSAVSAGFRILAGYIFGGNTSQSKIAMTAPVTMSSLPKPDDERIALKQIKSRRVAVLKFSGLWTEGNLNARREELAAMIKKKSLKPKGEATYAFYDPPWKPFFWRRNEVMQEIESR